jgi:hypothetical protein
MYKNNPFLFANVLLYDQVSDGRKAIVQKQIKKELNCLSIGFKCNAFNNMQKQEIILLLSQSETLLQFLGLKEYSENIICYIEKDVFQADKVTCNH